MSEGVGGARLVRLPEVIALVGLGKTKIYAMVKDGKFPAPVKVGHASLWRSDAVVNWMESLVDGL